MRIELIEVEPIVKYPTVVAVLKTLVDLNYEVSLYTLSVPEELRTYCRNANVNLVEIGGEYKHSSSALTKLSDLIRIRKQLWCAIRENEREDSILWVFSTITLKHLGSELLRHKYIIHFFELVEKLYYFKKYGKIEIATYCKKAQKVVVCEENRAHITRTWFKLNALPFILPNKPYEEGINKNSEITYASKAKNLMEKLNSKKIILYQGILDDERPLEEFIYAAQILGDEYAFLIMSGSENRYKHIKSDNYYFMGYIPAPYHLEITSHAHIGVLCYTPNNSGYSSPLNSIYCAPNKIFEYAKFGIPMIGNNIPGLNYTIRKGNFGVCTDKLASSAIVDAIIEIEKNYSDMGEKALSFYRNTNYAEIIQNIISANADE